MAEKDKEALLELMRKRFKRCLDDPSEEDNRKRALEAIKFRALQQWPEKIKNERENDTEGSRPCLVMDEINQYINQVKNDYRQNRPSIKARPVDDKGDKEVAEVFQGLIRHIEDTSNADIAYDTAFDQALDGGFGYFRVITDYADDESFDQDIKIVPIKNRFAVRLDPDRQLPDGSDSMFGFIDEWTDEDEYKRSYPKFDISSWAQGDEGYTDWRTDKRIRIVEYFYVEQTVRTMILLPDNTTAFEDEWPEDAGEIPKELKTRQVELRKVCWVKSNGKHVLEKSEWPGKWIPIIEVIGNEIDIEGKSKKSGLVEAAMDPQRMHNYSASSFVEQVALAPKAPFIAAVGQLEGRESDWKTANRRNLSVLEYNPVDVNGNPVSPPIRQPSPGIPPGWQAIMEHSRGWVQSSMGMYNTSLGAPSSARSGKAILAEKHEGDTATFHYSDNMAKSIRHCGRIIIDLIPKIYDTKRIVRLLEEDGTEDYATFDPSIHGPTAEQQLLDGSIKKIYNPTVGKYDVTISVGPSYTTKRQEGAEMMTQVLQGNKEMMSLIGDIYFRILDVPYGDKIAERLKAMLPPQVLQAENDKQSQSSPEKMKMVIQQLEGQLQEAQQMMQGMQQAVGEKEQELQQAEQTLNGQAAQIKQDLTELNAQKQIMTETFKRLSAELALKQSQAEQSSNEENVAKQEQSDAGVIQGFQLFSQSLQQNTQVLAQLAESVARMSGPKKITLPDGSVAMTEPMMESA